MIYIVHSVTQSYDTKVLHHDTLTFIDGRNTGTLNSEHCTVTVVTQNGRHFTEEHGRDMFTTPYTTQ